MPVQINQLRFVGTGKPIKPELKNLRVIREPSVRGILQSDIESVSEFRRIYRIKSRPTPWELGRNYSKTLRKVISGLKVVLIV